MALIQARKRKARSKRLRQRCSARPAASMSKLPALQITCATHTEYRSDANRDMSEREGSPAFAAVSAARLCRVDTRGAEKLALGILIMGGADFRQQQEQEEQAAFLWFSLNNLRDHISAEVFQAAERELGFDDRRNRNERNGNGNQKSRT